MMFSQHTLRSALRRLGAVCVVVCGLSATVVFAQQATSSSFMTIKSGFTQLGGYSTTTSFAAFESIDPNANGESTSTNFYLSGGYLYFEQFTPESKNWRWYGDANNVTPTSALASENVSPTNIEELDPIKLRVSVEDVANAGQLNAKFRLQYSTSSDFSEGVYFVEQSWACTGSSVWCYVDGGGNDNATIPTALLSDADSCVASVGPGCGTHNESGTSTSAYTHTAGATTEYEFTIQRSGGIDNMVYFFRLFDTVSSSSVPRADGESYPSLSAYGVSLTFSIEGLSSGTSTEGVTTDVATTPQAVPFGTLTFGGQTRAAHRLKVSTSALQGYKIFAYQRQGLLNAYANEIAPVTGTNDTPLAWSSGCAATSTSCYGYHSGEDVLEGGSTRFAADDSFARFTQSPVEVAYGSGPSEDRETDIVYKVGVTTQQQSGEYAGAIVYIVMPVF